MVNISTQSANPPKVFAAIASVMAAVSHVKKTGENKHHRYAFASESDLIIAVRPAMIRAGLILIPTGKEIIEHNSGSKMTHVSVKGKFAFISVEDGSSVVVEVLASAADSQDKYLSKAETQLEKYALVQTFLLPRLMTDPDYESPDNLKAFESWCSSFGGFEAVRGYCYRRGFGDPSEWSTLWREEFMSKVGRGDLAIDIEVEQ